MRFSASSKVGTLLTSIAIAALISAFLVMGIPRSAAAYARSSSPVTTFQGRHGVAHLAYSGLFSLNASSHQAGVSRTQPLIPLLGHHTAVAGQGNFPLSASTVMGSGQTSVLHNFNGLNSVDSFNVNGFILEPPDQGLCVGSLTGTKVVGEIINDVVAFYTPGGSLFSSKENLNTFFAEPATEEMTDPRCYFDPIARTWFFTVLALAPTATFLPNHVDIAVLHTNLREFVVRVDVTFAANAAGGCPCLGDQPKLGIDKNNVYITVDQFNTAETAETGVDLIALSKSQLVAGSSTIEEAVFLNLALAGIPITTLQPAITNSDVDEEFLLNSFPYDARGDNNPFSRTLGLWSLSNTESVTAGGVPTLSATTITSELYAFPAAALTTNGLSLATFTNDSRMQQVQYIDGHLWGALDTALLFNGSPVAFDGIAWFEIQPQVDSSGMIVGGSFTHQGYVGSPGYYLIYPAIEHTAQGTTGISFSLTNPTLNPSTGYVERFSDSASFDAIHITAVGSGPDIGFTCTLGFPQQCRWGDYSWSALDPNGQDIWMAAEDIVPPVATQVVSGMTLHTNWGTRVWDVAG